MHTVVVGLGYGDESKGGTVDWLCATRPVHTVIRCGGAQALHHVISPTGVPHGFAQFGSGTFHGSRTHLSKFMMVDPLRLAHEELALRKHGVTNAYDLLSIHAECLLTTPYHSIANKLRELQRGEARHGSCGVGIGETVTYNERFPLVAPHWCDASTPVRLRKQLIEMRNWLFEEFGSLPHAWRPLVGFPDVDELVDAYSAMFARIGYVNDDHLPAVLASQPCVFEGNQGVLLDEWHGFHPHTTWLTTTTELHNQLLDGAEATRLGVLRTYTTRHGHGPLVTENEHILSHVPEAHNQTGEFMGAFRVGAFDAVAHRYAIDVCGDIDGLVMTHCDRRIPFREVCTGYEIDGLAVDRLDVHHDHDLMRQGELTERLFKATPVYTSFANDTGTFAYDAGTLPWIRGIEDILSVPVVARSHGPRWQDKEAWPDGSP